MSPKSSLYEDKHRSSMKHESKKKVRNIRGRSSSYNSTKIDREKKRNRSRSRNRDEDREYKKDNYDTKTTKKSRWSDVPPNDNKATNLNLDNFNQLSTKPLDNFNTATALPKIYEFSPLLNKDSVLPQTISSIYNNILESNKFKRKVYFPKQIGVNYVGLLIGPKGAYQKRLESQTNCKILIRGKGTQKDGVTPQPDDDEEQHVLIVGNSDENVIKAELLVQKVLYSDEQTRNKIKEEQLRVAQEIRTDQYSGVENLLHIEDHLMTPYGPPDKNARIIQVPNDCVGMIIGKNGETIRRLHREAGCKIQIAKAPIPNTEVRNVFIEGPPEKYDNAKKLIEEIVAEVKGIHFYKSN